MMVQFGDMSWRTKFKIHRHLKCRCTWNSNVFVHQFNVHLWNTNEDTYYEIWELSVTP